MNANIDKHLNGATSKRLRLRRRSLPVTNSTRVTGNRVGLLFNRYNRLRPWLMLCDVRDDHEPVERTAVKNPAPELRALAQNDPDKLQSLRTEVLAALHAVATAVNGPRPFIEASRIEKGYPEIPRGRATIHLSPLILVAKVEGGRVNLRMDGLFEAFRQALDGAEAARIKWCPECEGVYYAVPLDRKACSARCNNARRVRQWRANQEKYEYSRKLTTAGLKQKRKGKL